MEVFIVVWSDRHTDVSVDVFSDKDAAINYAKQNAKSMDRHGDLDETLEDSMVKAGWLYCGCYSCEGCNIRVEKKEVK